jgi:signal transduction histidine kinase
MLAESFESALAERKLKLTISDDLKRLPDIEADADLLGKAFYHLIINAIKYTPDGGRIALSGRELDAGHPKLAEGGIEVVVSDTGIGIDPRYHELIFTKFYQTGEVALHSSGKTKFRGGGPGLGLAIARGIIEAHGGKVWVESPGYDEEKFPGSHFHVALPLRQPERLALSEADLMLHRPA